MISPDSCSQLVAGNYDVLVGNEPALRSILTEYLHRFQLFESEIGQPGSSYLNEFRLLKEFSRALKEDKDNLKIGEEEFNLRKNRYKDIIPFSHTRVVLNNDPQVPGSCYINANYIRGPLGSPKTYIACQGPLPCTLVDFWRMIWECGVSVVVMACNEHEAGKPKCEAYWPAEINTNVFYGNFQITLLKERQICRDFLVRKFSVKYYISDNYSSATNPTLNITATPQATTTKSTCNTTCSPIASSMPDIQTMSSTTIKTETTNLTSTSAVASTTITTNPILLPGTNLNDNVNLNGTIQRGFDNDSGVWPPNGYNYEQLSDSDRNNIYYVSNSNHNSTPASETSAYNSESNSETGSNNNNLKCFERTICQFHYTTWPDHGAPDSVQPILELVRLMREVQPAEDKPILIHCSAGCGRTGTICCIDYVWGLLRSGKIDLSFDLCSIISEMRQQRMAMVQTLEQYILCHRAVAALFINQLKLIDDHVYENLDYETGVRKILGRGYEKEDEDEEELGPVFL